MSALDVVVCRYLSLQPGAAIRGFFFVLLCYQLELKGVCLETVERYSNAVLPKCMAIQPISIFLARY